MVSIQFAEWSRGKSASLVVTAEGVVQVSMSSDVIKEADTSSQQLDWLMEPSGVQSLVKWKVGVVHYQSVFATIIFSPFYSLVEKRKATRALEKRIENPKDIS